MVKLKYTSAELKLYFAESDQNNCGVTVESEGDYNIMVGLHDVNTGKRHRELTLDVDQVKLLHTWLSVVLEKD